VLTGGASAQDLAAAGATAVVPDLAADEAYAFLAGP
jgi:hypothetical protein